MDDKEIIGTCKTCKGFIFVGEEYEELSGEFYHVIGYCEGCGSSIWEGDSFVQIREKFYHADVPCLLDGSDSVLIEDLATCYGCDYPITCIPYTVTEGGHPCHEDVDCLIAALEREDRDKQAHMN